MGEGYLVHEAMRVCCDIISDMDKYAPQVWKEEEDEWKIGLDYLLFDIRFIMFSSYFYLDLLHHF